MAVTTCWISTNLPPPSKRAAETAATGARPANAGQDDPQADRAHLHPALSAQGFHAPPFGGGKEASRHGHLGISSFAALPPYYRNIPPKEGLRGALSRRMRREFPLLSQGPPRRMGAESSWDRPFDVVLRGFRKFCRKGAGGGAVRRDRAEMCIHSPGAEGECRSLFRECPVRTFLKP